MADSDRSIGSVADTHQESQAADDSSANISPPEVALLRARWPAVLAFAARANRDRAFWDGVQAVWFGDSPAQVVASKYARGHAASANLERLIEWIADGDPRWWDYRLYANVGIVSTFVRAEPPAGLPQNSVQQRALERFAHGAECIVRRGGGRCIRCGEQLQSLVERSTPLGDGRTWPMKRNYCGACVAAKDPPAGLTDKGKKRWRRNAAANDRRDRAAVESVLDELAADLPTESRASALRAKRLADPA